MVSGPFRSVMFADSLKGVICQILCKRIGGGRVPSMEVMISTPSISNLVREGKTFQIPSMIQTGKKYGMQLLDDAILDLLNKGWITGDDAYLKCNDKARFRPFLKNPPTDFTEV